MYVKYSKEPTDQSASPNPWTSCPLQHCMQLVMGSHFLDTKCHLFSPHYWCLWCVEVFLCIQDLVLVDLAVLFTAQKVNSCLFLWLNVDFLKARVQVPVILDLGTRWRWVVRFTAWTADVSCGGHKCHSGPRSEQKNCHCLCKVSKLKPSSV